MQIAEGRGRHRKQISDENKTTVKLYFHWNPGASIGDCCKATGLSYPTVRRHIDAIQAEEGEWTKS